MTIQASELSEKQFLNCKKAALETNKIYDIFRREYITFNSLAYKILNIIKQLVQILFSN